MEDSSSLPLTQYTNNVPTGWKAGLPNYPLSRYNQLIQIWYRLTDFTDEQVRPAVAGRLQGRANSLALELRVTRQDGTVLVGDSALAFPGETATQHAAAVKAGLQALLEVLARHYGIEPEAQTAQHIDDFLDLRRGSKDLNTYLVEFDYRYDHARSSAGLVINNVGLSHLLLKHLSLIHI